MRALCAPRAVRPDSRASRLAVGGGRDRAHEGVPVLVERREGGHARRWRHVPHLPRGQRRG
eukprot:3438430-Prymnesium_polylepis.1